MNIQNLAYKYTRKPPKTIRPRDNVIVRLCSIECCFAHPLAACESPEDKRFCGDIIAWQPAAPKLYVWDYTPNFAHYEQPFPNLAALQPNVQFFVAHGVKGLFEQGNYSSGGYGELGPLRAYLLAELLWNPEIDVQKCTSEFLNAYYGKAAPKLAAYLRLLEAQVKLPDVHAHIYDAPTSKYLNQEFIASADSILSEAEKAANSPAIRQRVQVARLPIWYVQLAANQVKDSDRAGLLKHFLEVARKAGLSNINEGESLDAWAAAMK